MQLLKKSAAVETTADNHGPVEIVGLAADARINAMQAKLRVYSVCTCTTLIEALETVQALTTHL